MSNARKIAGLAVSAGLLSLIAACGSQHAGGADGPTGPNPVLPAPHHYLFPPMGVAKVIGWKAGATPEAAPGLKVTALVTGLPHPRWVYALPNGDILVAEANDPEAPPPTRAKDIVMGLVMGHAGAASPSANRIELIRPGQNGRPATRSVFISGLNHPFGIALVGSDLYVADTDAVVRFAYTPGATSIATPGVKMADLPAGPIDHHWTKNIIASPDGSKLYVTVGSNSNIGENGIAAEYGRAAIYEMDRASGRMRQFAGGIRNPNGMGWEPTTGALWTVANERDELGDDLVPDYLTSVKDGGFYGWPYSYYGQHVDTRVQPQMPDLVKQAIPPDYALGSHVAPLGMTFDTGSTLPAQYRGGAFVGEHGSWNRANPHGYKVVFVPFRGGKPAGQPVTVLSGFMKTKGKVQGRPVGVAFDRTGALLVADDVGGVIWRVTAG